MAESLSRDKIVDLETYLVAGGFLPTYFEDYGSDRSKIRVSGLLKIYSWFVSIFLLLFIIRSLFVVFVDDLYLQWILGHSYVTHNYFHWVVIFHALYTYVVYRINWSSARSNVMALDWIEVFQLLQGSKEPTDLGTNIRITEMLSRYARRKLAHCRYLMGIRLVMASIVLADIYMNENSWISLSEEGEVDYYAIGWAVVLMIAVFLNTLSLYLVTTMFDIVAYYFRIRFRKVNQDVKTIIACKESKMTNVKPIELMRQILVEHDFLCWKLDKYNRYWCLVIMASFSLYPVMFTYTMYEIFFKPQSWLGLISIWALCFESLYLFFRMFLAGIALNDEVHHVYLRVVKASLAAKYPIDMRLQVRLFVQRISGPPIGFYCFNLFGLSRHSLYHALVHLGQNFFLIIDFMVSQKQARQLIAEARAARVATMANPAMALN